MRRKNRFALVNTFPERRLIVLGPPLPLRPEPFDAPAAFGVPRVAEAVVEAAALALPELDGCSAERQYPPQSMEERNIVDADALRFPLGVAAPGVRPRIHDHFALVARPRRRAGCSSGLLRKYPLRSPRARRLDPTVPAMLDLPLECPATRGPARRSRSRPGRSPFAPLVIREKRQTPR